MRRPHRWRRIQIYDPSHIPQVYLRGARSCVVFDREASGQRRRPLQQRVVLRVFRSISVIIARQCLSKHSTPGILLGPRIRGQPENSSRLVIGIHLARSLTIVGFNTNLFVNHLDEKQATNLSVARISQENL